jgi:transcription initiation factor TFIIH subunit 1
MSESDFWTKFFQSYYVRRDQSNLATNDIFSDCSARDDEGWLSFLTLTYFKR